jgi:hypothetical protein
VRARRGEEGQQPPVLALDVAQIVAPEAGDLSVGQVPATQEVVRREQGRNWVRDCRRATTRPWCSGFRQGEGTVDRRQVGVRRDGLVIRLEPSEETPMRRSAGREG